MGRAECPNGCKEHPAAPDHKSYVPPSSNSPHSKPQGINYLQSLYWFDQRNSVDWCQEVISGFLLLIEGCPGLWKIETYSIKDASFNQVCEILKICLSSKGGESIPVFLLRLIALVRWYAGTLGSSYVAETPTYSRGWYWLAIEQILSSGMVLVDDVDLFLEAPGFDQSTIVFQFFFCYKFGLAKPDNEQFGSLAQTLDSFHPGKGRTQSGGGRRRRSHRYGGWDGVNAQMAAKNTQLPQIISHMCHRQAIPRIPNHKASITYKAYIGLIKETQ